MPNRRRFLQGISSLPLLATPSAAATVKRDYFKELGIKPFIKMVFHVFHRTMHAFVQPLFKSVSIIIKFLRFGYTAKIKTQ